MMSIIKKYWIVILLLLGIGGIFSWYDPNYCYKEDKKYTDADFKDGIDNGVIVVVLARDYGLVRIDGSIPDDSNGETHYNQNDMKKLEVEVDDFYKKHPNLKFGKVYGKDYTRDPDLDYAVKGAQYYFAPNDIQIVNSHLNKRLNPPKKTVVGFYFGQYFSKCGKYTGDYSDEYGEQLIYEGDKSDLELNPYKQTNKQHNKQG